MKFEKMKMWIVWHLPKKFEKMKMWIVWRLPKWMIYWSAVRLMAHATTGSNSHVVVPELLAMDALKAWE